jgi:hypothetical protein
MKFKVICLSAVLAVSTLLFLQIPQSNAPIITASQTIQNRARKAVTAPQSIQDAVVTGDIETAHIAELRGNDQRLSANSGEPFIQTSINPEAFTSVLTFLPSLSIDQASAVDGISVSGDPANRFPSVDEFAADVRSQGMNGLWADGLFAYRFYSADWGMVPDSMNTAAYSGYKGYHAYFIHNYLGGSRLYNAGIGVQVAVITPDSINWYEIDGVYRFAGTSTGNGCEYTAPFYDWDGGNAYSAMDLVSTYYSSPFAIQTCICTGNKNGILILTGSPK